VSNATPRGRKSPSSDVGAKTINLALQGGGAHGALIWGVLDRLLEDERINIEGISATSAGAMNAHGPHLRLCEGRSRGCKAALAQFWWRVSLSAMHSPPQPSWLDRMIGNHSLRFSPAFIMIDLITRLFSPYEFNPLNRNPLVLEESVNFAALRRSHARSSFSR
jgi:NTE family protein